MITIHHVNYLTIKLLVVHYQSTLLYLVSVMRLINNHPIIQLRNKSKSNSLTHISAIQYCAQILLYRYYYVGKIVALVIALETYIGHNYLGPPF